LALGALLVSWGRPAHAVTISQLLPEFTAKPGDTIEQVVQLYDDSMQGVTVYPTVYNFTADPDKEGAVLILTDPKDFRPDREWLKFDQTEVTLPEAGTLVDFPYRIEVPKNAEPGTHLISLVFQTKPVLDPDQRGAAVYIGSNVATNIFLKVLGTTIDQIELDFQAGVFSNDDPELSAAERRQYFTPKTFFLKPPVDFLVIANNTGNTHQKPDGNIKIVNDLFGGNPEKLLINPENRIILPDTERSFASPSFGQGLMFGKYRAKLTLVYGEPLRPVEKEIVFWIVPLVEILIVLGILLFIVVLIIVIVKLRKKKSEKQDKEKEDRMRKEIVEQIARQGLPQKATQISKQVKGSNGTAKGNNGKKQKSR